MSSEQDERKSDAETSGATAGSAKSAGSTTSGGADTMRDNTKVDIRDAGEEGGGKTEAPDRQRDAT